MKVICVPVSLEAMTRLDYDQSIDGDLIEINLNQNLYNEIWESVFFDRVNFLTNKNIDDYEDESIDDMNDLRMLLAILSNYLDQNSFFKEMYDLVKLAIKFETGVFFFF